MIYLDNAATTYIKPRDTYSYIKFCLKKCGGNPGRSSHSLSAGAGELIYRAREAVTELLGTDEPEKVVFCENATHALNLAIKSYITKTCHVIISDVEHNSVVRPLEKLKRTLGIEYSTYDTDLPPDEAIAPLIREDTVGIVSTLASNVTGKTTDIGALSRIAKERGLFLIVDASQAIGHGKINLAKTPCDVLCAPSHKALFGIQGSGFAVFRDGERANTLIEGGSGSDSRNTEMPSLLPEGYEAGTPPTPAIASLLGGIEFIRKVGIDEIENKLNILEQKLAERVSAVPGSILYSSGEGIVTFNLSNLTSSRIEAALDECGICVRGGLHCAPSAHRKLGTLERGAVRLSLSYFNKVSELDKVYKALCNISFQPYGFI